MLPLQYIPPLKSSCSLPSITSLTNYSLLYKSYIILTSLSLTIICNCIFLYMKSSGNDQDNFDDTGQGILSFIGNVFVMKTKYSLVFFEIMVLTLIQILFQTLKTMKYRFMGKKSKLAFIKQQISNAQSKLRHTDPKHSKTIKSKQSKQKMTQQQYQQQQILQQSGITFVYLFSLIYAQSLIWQGIYLKKWRNIRIHVVFIVVSCVEFFIWNLINTTLKRQQEFSLAKFTMFTIDNTTGEIVFANTQ